MMIINIMMAAMIRMMRMMIINIMMGGFPVERTSFVPCSGGGVLPEERKGWIDDNQINRWIPCLPVREPLIDRR
jgi:hypothetical protein